MHAGAVDGVHISLNEELHSVAAVGVVVRLAVGGHVKVVPLAAVSVVSVCNGVVEAESIQVRHRSRYLVSQHADYAIHSIVIVYGLSDGG